MNKKKAKTLKVVEKFIYVKTVDGSMIRGKINIGSNKRISDMFMIGEAPFIVLYDVVQQQDMPKKVLVINKRHIIWVEPDEPV
jgi:hypothetical protein